MLQSIWNTVESDAWSRAFNYQDYLFLCEKHGASKPLSFDAYQVICEIFDEELEASFK